MAGDPLEPTRTIPRQHPCRAAASGRGGGDYRRRLDGIPTCHHRPAERRRGCNSGAGAVEVVLSCAVPAHVPQQPAGRMGMSAASGGRHPGPPRQTGRLRAVPARADVDPRGSGELWLSGRPRCAAYGESGHSGRTHRGARRGVGGRQVDLGGPCRGVAGTPAGKHHHDIGPCPDGAYQPGNPHLLRHPLRRCRIGASRAGRGLA